MTWRLRDEAEPIRLEAARALGSLRTEGLESDGERLIADASPRGVVRRLVAALMLRRHRGGEAVKLLRRLAADPEPAVAVLAVARLAEIDAALVVPMVEHLLASPDAGLRSLAVDALFQLPTEERIRLLGDHLADADPDVRRQARRRLELLAADKPWRDRVVAEATRLLADRPWQGQEQAAILLTLLDHKPAASRLVELLPSDRPEVCITAAWGLRRLAMRDTVPAVLTYVENAEKLARATAAGRPGQLAVPIEILDHQLSQLNQLLGDQGASQPRPSCVCSSRAWRSRCARWHVQSRGPPRSGPWAGFAPADWTTALASALEGRLNDSGSLPPEDVRIRSMSAVALGRMKAVGFLPSLRKGFTAQESNFDRVNNACGWAVEQITGEVVPPPKVVRRLQGPWFAIPNGQP